MNNWCKLLVFTAVSILHACSNPITYRVTIPDSSAPQDPYKVKVFMETSVSMKGYVNANMQGDYKLKEIVPFLITDIDQHLNGCQLYTVTDVPKLYTNTKSQFYESLKDGSILEGKSSRIHNIFNLIIDSLSATDVSLLISDCILDFGQGVDNQTESVNIVTSIYEHLSQKNISAAVFQFYSDFNGDYYFDRKNTGGLTPNSRPFSGKIMHKRPFYVWILGNAEAIKKLLTNNIIRDYEQMEFFNVDFQDIPYKVLSHPQGGKIIINSKTREFTIRGADEKIPASVTVGINLSTLPSGMRSTTYLQNNFYIPESHIKVNFKLFDIASLKKEPGFDKIEKVINENELTHFIKLNFTEISKEDGDFQLILRKSAANWIDVASITDDVGLPGDSLEGKTFSFKNLVKPFYRLYPDDELITIKFEYNVK